MDGRNALEQLQPELTYRNAGLFADGRNVSGYLNKGRGQENCFEAKGAGDPLKLNVWTPVALTYDGDTLRVFCDGKEVGAKQVGRVRTAGKAPLTVGKVRAGLSSFDCGDLDEVRLFNRALGAHEIARADDVADGLVKHWDFDQTPDLDAAAMIAAKAGLEPKFKPLMDVKRR